jgi:L-amino acid N-acyltransferase YncA
MQIIFLIMGFATTRTSRKKDTPQKFNWLKDRFTEGLKLKVLVSSTDGTQGMIEYIPGELCWRPVEASDYMFIHCIFSGFKRAYKGKGYGSLLLKEVVEDAKKQKMFGVAVVTLKRSFMADKDLFVKHSFEVVDVYPPDFELLAKKFDKNTPKPKFNKDARKKLGKYKIGLTVMRADQCPYTVKNVKEIVESPEKIFGL